jgi:hypothetical protein
MILVMRGLCHQAGHISGSMETGVGTIGRTHMFMIGDTGFYHVKVVSTGKVIGKLVPVANIGVKDIGKGAKNNQFIVVIYENVTVTIIGIVVTVITTN